MVATLTRFDIYRAAQASAILLRRAQRRRMSRMRLMKLLALADRESIRLTGRPITGDQHVAMEHGHVLSQTYNLIRLHPHPHRDKWRNWFANDDRDVVLVCDPGDGQLSNHDIEVLSRIESEFRNFTTAQLRSYSHSLLDWKKNDPGEGGQKPIPVTDTIEGVGLSHKQAMLLKAAEEEKAADAAIAAFR